MSATIWSIAARSHRRMSVATWSLRERAGVQPLAGVADEIGQPLLDIEMHVLEVERPLERAALDLRRGSAASPRSIAARSSAERMPHAVQHARMRERAFDVEVREPLIESHRRGEALDEIVDRLIETPGPQPRR